MRISDWSSDVCSSDLLMERVPPDHRIADNRQVDRADQRQDRRRFRGTFAILPCPAERDVAEIKEEQDQHRGQPARKSTRLLQSLLLISYSVFCMKIQTQVLPTT